MEDQFAAMIAYVQSAFRESGSHGFDHVLRVTLLCERLGADEQADMRILLPAALFHDIGRPAEEATGIPHEEEGARIAERYLRSVRYDDARIPAIVHAIRTHRFRSAAIPETPEARILSDADKLDAMGAVGIARTFMQAGERGGDMTDAAGHITEKLLLLRDRLYTASARRMAQERHAVLVAFLAALTDELAVPPPPRAPP
ncbi:MAG: phosphohydrolase [Methanoculleus sp. SDB]|nr:MAG: phosphohydrolase [Methanoculleus sp. SDB]